MATVGAPAQGSGPGDGGDPELPDGARVLSAEEALAVNAEMLGEQEGVPADVMAERLRFQEAVDALRESWPATVLEESYAGGTMVWGTTPQAVLYFKGSVPPVVQSQVAREGLSGVQLVGGQRYSLHELQARQNAAHDAVTALGFQSVYSSFDLTTQHIDVGISLNPDLPELREPQQIRDAVVAELSSSWAAVSPDELAVTTHPAGTQMLILQHGYGGAGIRENGGSQFVCTSGFSVRRNSDGLKGYVTAAHCEGITQMEQNNASGGVDLVFSSPFVNEHIGARGEIEWHYTSHDSFPEFWSSICCRSPVTDRIANSQIDENDYICRYGRATAPSCGYVVNVSTSFTYWWAYCSCYVTAYDMVKAVGASSGLGDSGGPWFLGLTAYGIHTGAKWENGVYYTYFSKIQNAEIQFGVSVMTQSL